VRILRFVADVVRTISLVPPSAELAPERSAVRILRGLRPAAVGRPRLEFILPASSNWGPLDSWVAWGLLFVRGGVAAAAWKECEIDRLVSRKAFSLSETAPSVGGGELPSRSAGQIANYCVFAGYEGVDVRLGPMAAALPEHVSMEIQDQSV